MDKWTQSESFTWFFSHIDQRQPMTVVRAPPENWHPAEVLTTRLPFIVMRIWIVYQFREAPYSGITWFSTGRHPITVDCYVRLLSTIQFLNVYQFRQVYHRELECVPIQTGLPPNLNVYRSGGLPFAKDPKGLVYQFSRSPTHQYT